MTIIVQCDQGSPDWHIARAGVITASNFREVRKRIGALDEKQQRFVDAVLAGQAEKQAMLTAGYRQKPKSETVYRAIEGLPVGDFTSEAKNYAFRLAIERISGVPLDEGFETWTMERGHELEPDARREHEIAAGVAVQRAGFVLTDDRIFGASADGLIDLDGGSEYKCFLAPDKLRAILIDGDTSELDDQVQGCMWITGRRYWHIGLYCPALRPIGKQLWWREVRRDDDYIEALELDLLAFKALVDSNEAKLRSGDVAADPPMALAA